MLHNISHITCWYINSILIICEHYIIIPKPAVLLLRNLVGIISLENEVSINSLLYTSITCI